MKSRLAVFAVFFLVVPFQVLGLEFVGRSLDQCDVRVCSERKARAAEFMLANEMQQLIAYLTGYSHGDFRQFDALIGKIDLDSRTRTNDKVSPLITLVLLKIANEVALSVVQREVFLDDDERLVFAGIDIENSPSDDELRNFVHTLYEEWLLIDMDDATADMMMSSFRVQETNTNTMDAFQQLVAQLLQHGGLYYY